MALNLGLVLCARPESGLCHMPSAFSLSKPWLGPVCQHWIQPLREERDWAPCRPGTLRTGADYKRTCLTWGSALYAAGESCIVLLPSRLRTHISTASGTVSHRASDTFVCPAELQNHPFSPRHKLIGRVSASQYLII